MSKNSKENFLVGNRLTIADCAWGAWLLKFYIGDTFVHHKIFAAEVEKFPKVKKYAEGTIRVNFGTWFMSKPSGMGQGM